MDRQKIIDKWFKRLAFVTIALAVIGFLIAQTLPIQERLAMLFVPIIGYSMMYYFIGFGIRSQLRQMVGQHTIYKIALSATILFSQIAIFSGILGTASILLQLLVQNDSKYLGGLGLPAGVSLGGWSLYNYVIGIKNEH